LLFINPSNGNHAGAAGTMLLKAKPLPVNWPDPFPSICPSDGLVKIKWLDLRRAAITAVSLAMPR